MPEIINNQLSIINCRGSVLLVVLFVIMAITILSLGFLTRSDAELACGQNMALRIQMDQLADSGLQHARGLILNPQDISTEYWKGAQAQQLVTGSKDYYDVAVVRNESDTTDYCNYTIDCNAYRMSNGEEVGRSNLTAELRLDPSIALWVGTGTTLWSGLTVYGDVYCNDGLINQGTIDGDVFAGSLTGIGTRTGQLNPQTLSLIWPSVTVTDFTSRYGTTVISTATLADTTLGPYEPPRVHWRTGNLVLAGNVRIDGMLLVNGNLTIRATNNVIVAGKNLPAIYVTGDFIIERGASLQITGLVVVGNRVLINRDTSLSVLGGMFANGIFAETAADSSSNNHTFILYNGPTGRSSPDRPFSGPTNGSIECDGLDDKLEDLTAGSYLNGLSAITVSLWVKSDITNQDRDIFFTRDPTGADEELGLRYDKNGAYGGAVRCIKASVRTTTDYTQIESTSDKQTTVWQHLALVWQNGGPLNLYINGQLNSLTYHKEGHLSGTITGVQKFMLGQGTKSWSEGKPWDGLIDDVRIYNRVLDVNDIYPPRDGLTGLLAHWKFDETGSSATVTITAEPAKTAIIVWSPQGTPQAWDQAAGAFFRSIRRR